MGPRADLDRREISPHWDSIPGASSPQSVAIRLSCPPHKNKSSADKKICTWLVTAHTLPTIITAQMKTIEVFITCSKRRYHLRAVMNYIQEVPTKCSTFLFIVLYSLHSMNERMNDLDERH